MKKLKTGDPLEESTDLGPLIRESDAVRASDWIQEAVRGGARLLCGGQRKGSMLEPTVLTGTRPEMKVNCQEIFAPVVTVEPYDDFDEALRQINNSPYGLQAGIFTRDAKLFFNAFEELEVGGLMAGDVPAFRIDHMPYGGVKDSGLGREGLALRDRRNDRTQTAGDEPEIDESRCNWQDRLSVAGSRDCYPHVLFEQIHNFLNLRSKLLRQIRCCYNHKFS